MVVAFLGGVVSGANVPRAWRGPRRVSSGYVLAGYDAGCIDSMGSRPHPPFEVFAERDRGVPVVEAPEGVPSMHPGKARRSAPP
jgi:hypothetical protein